MCNLKKLFKLLLIRNNVNIYIFFFIHFNTQEVRGHWNCVFKVVLLETASASISEALILQLHKKDYIVWVQCSSCFFYSIFVNTFLNVYVPSTAIVLTISFYFFMPKLCKLLCISRVVFLSMRCLIVNANIWLNFAQK